MSGPATLLLVVLFALAFAALTLILLPLITTFPRSAWRPAGLKPHLTNALLFSLAGGLLPMALRQPAPWPFVGVLCGGASVIIGLFWVHRPQRRAKDLATSLKNESQRATAMAAFGPALDALRPRAARGARLTAWSQSVLFCAASLLDADEPGVARTMLERLSGLNLTGPLLTQQGVLWAHVEALSHNVTAARLALSSVARPVQLPMSAAYHEAVEALVLACEGHASIALSRLDGWKAPDGWHGKTRLFARIVATTQSHDDDARIRAQAELARRFGSRSVTLAQELAKACTHDSALPVGETP
jgi:hypothetical protein